MLNEMWYECGSTLALFVYTLTITRGAATGSTDFFAFLAAEIVERLLAS